MLLLAGGNINAQIQQDSIKKNNLLLSKWRISGGYTLVWGFNLGEKFMTSFPYDPMWGGFWGYSYYTNAREKAQMGYQFYLETVSKSFLRQKVSIRMSIGLDKFYYKGIATRIDANRINPYTEPDIYTFDTCIDCREYYFKDHFISLSVLPQFNVERSNKAVFYFIIGPSLAILFKESSDRDINEWKSKKENFTLFGITGLGTTIKIVKGFYLETQLRFNCQIYKTPADRRLAAAGIRIGFMF